MQIDADIKYNTLECSLEEAKALGDAHVQQSELGETTSAGLHVM